MPSMKHLSLEVTEKLTYEQKLNILIMRTWMLMTRAHTGVSKLATKLAQVVLEDLNTRWLNKSLTNNYT